MPSMSEKNTKEIAEAVTTRVEAEVGPSVSAETVPVETIGKDTEQGPSERHLKVLVQYPFNQFQQALFLRELRAQLHLQHKL